MLLQLFTYCCFIVQTPCLGALRRSLSVPYHAISSLTAGWLGQLTSHTVFPFWLRFCFGAVSKKFRYTLVSRCSRIHDLLFGCLILCRLRDPGECRSGLHVSVWNVRWMNLAFLRERLVCPALSMKSDSKPTGRKKRKGMGQVLGIRVEGLMQRETCNASGDGSWSAGQKPGYSTFITRT